MKTSLAVIDRLTIFLVGVLLLVAGLVPAGLFFDIPYVSDWLRGIDRSVLTDTADSGWYIWALIALAALLIIGGVSMMVNNLRGRGFSKREVTGEDDPGTTTIHLAKFAQAIGNYLCQNEAINKVDTSVATIGKRPTITFTLDTDPSADLQAIVDLIDGMEVDLRDAVEDMDIDTVYKLHLSRVEL
ncbi:hypothetical protein [Corynebacterium pilosum]|uniref:Alkaline shock response membrane anchor protein AmaP n=1 Tax=Corynebacterium pilosum TaxID=35756 RepID=A0A376CME8_9CORY|nr:hypothetical protein [Corynebacterium pilosum]STC69610.1 Uncharacterised protein [Corynebacterium pilosum]